MAKYRLVYVIDTGKLAHDIDPITTHEIVEAESHDDALHNPDFERYGDRLINWFAFELPPDADDTPVRRITYLPTDAT